MNACSSPLCCLILCFIHTGSYTIHITAQGGRNHTNELRALGPGSKSGWFVLVFRLYDVGKFQNQYLCARARVRSTNNEILLATSWLVKQEMCLILRLHGPVLNATAKKNSQKDGAGFLHQVSTLLLCVLLIDHKLKHWTSSLTLCTFFASCLLKKGLHVRRISAKKRARPGKWREVERCEWTPEFGYKSRVSKVRLSSSSIYNRYEAGLQLVMKSC